MNSIVTIVFAAVAIMNVACLEAREGGVKREDAHLDAVETVLPSDSSEEITSGCPEGIDYIVRTIAEDEVRVEIPDDPDMAMDTVVMKVEIRGCTNLNFHGVGFKVQWEEEGEYSIFGLPDMHLSHLPEGEENRYRGWWYSAGVQVDHAYGMIDGDTDGLAEGDSLEFFLNIWWRDFPFEKDVVEQSFEVSLVESFGGGVLLDGHAGGVIVEYWPDGGGNPKGVYLTKPVRVVLTRAP